MTIPVEIAFAPDSVQQSGWLLANLVIDLLFFADIIITFNTTYFSSITGDEIFDKKKIARNYLKG